MRVLFVSTYFPPDVRVFVHGLQKRMAMLIEAIKEIAELDVLFYVPPGTDISPSAVVALERSFSEHWNAEIHLTLCSRLMSGVHFAHRLARWQFYGAGMVNFMRQGSNNFTRGVPQVQAFEACLQRKPDAIVAHRLEAMCPPLLTRQTLPPIVLDLDDIEHIAVLRGMRQQVQFREQLLSCLRLPALVWGERRAIRRARRTFVCSEVDRRYLTERWKLPGVVIVPNAVTIPTSQPLAEEPTLLLLGMYLYPANVLAAEFLIQQVWPRVYRAMPTARLLIAGHAPERIPSYTRGVPGVEFTGFVDDLEALYRRARVVCVPLLTSAGTAVKAIEAASYGKPIVATHIGAEGIELRDGEGILLRDAPEAFAEACLRLLRDAALCERLGSTARATAVRYYDRGHVVRLIQEHLTTALSGPVTSLQL
jgi:glycosyltransferase involved in cell wall biosynthesis